MGTSINSILLKIFYEISGDLAIGKSIFRGALMRILYDGEIYGIQKLRGINRYFDNIIS
jgi:hypothetical protein